MYFEMIPSLYVSRTIESRQVEIRIYERSRQGRLAITNIKQLLWDESEHPIDLVLRYPVASCHMGRIGTFNSSTPGQG